MNKITLDNIEPGKVGIFAKNGNFKPRNWRTHPRYTNRYCNKSNLRNKGCIRRKLHLLRLSCCRTNENSCRNPMPRKTTVTENRFSNYVILSFVSEAKLKWWIVRDLNPGPTGYEPVALTNWANDPYYYICIYGGNDGDRTHDNMVNSHVLFRLSYIPITKIN